VDVDVNMVKRMEKKNKRCEGCLTLCVASRGRGCQWELAGAGARAARSWSWCGRLSLLRCERVAAMEKLDTQRFA
jgi:hypothetical protein